MAELISLVAKSDSDMMRISSVIFENYYLSSALMIVPELKTCIDLAEKKCKIKSLVCSAE